MLSTNALLPEGLLPGSMLPGPLHSSEPEMLHSTAVQLPTVLQENVLGGEPADLPTALLSSTLPSAMWALLGPLLPTTGPGSVRTQRLWTTAELLRPMLPTTGHDCSPNPEQLLPSTTPTPRKQLLPSSLLQPVASLLCHREAMQAEVLPGLLLSTSTTLLPESLRRTTGSTLLPETNLRELQVPNGLLPYAVRWRGQQWMSTTVPLPTKLLPNSAVLPQADNSAHPNHWMHSEALLPTATELGLLCFRQALPTTLLLLRWTLLLNTSAWLSSSE